MATITPDMNIAHVLNMDRGSAKIFFENGLHCLGCPSSIGESIEEACEIHGIDPNKLVKELNDFFASKQA